MKKERRSTRPKPVEEVFSDELTVEGCKYLTITRVKDALEEIMESEDPPVFVLHNQNLAAQAKASEAATADQAPEADKGEIMDVLVLHWRLGLMVLEVEPTENRQNYSCFDEAANKLTLARAFIQEESGDLVHSDEVILTMVMPNLKPEDAQLIRKEAQARKEKKQKSSVTKTAEQGANATPATDSKPGKELLEDHPDILVVCGNTHEVFQEWVTTISQRRESRGHAFKGPNDQERLDNFKRACMRRLSVTDTNPAQRIRDYLFFLTKDEIQVRDVHSKLHGKWGPPGSGRTVILAERARDWVRERRREDQEEAEERWITPQTLPRVLRQDRRARVSMHRH